MIGYLHCVLAGSPPSGYVFHVLPAKETKEGTMGIPAPFSGGGARVLRSSFSGSLK